MTPAVRSLSSLLGGSRELSLFETLALRSETALSAADICRFSGVSWATTHRRLGDWERLGIVVESGRVGKAKLFTLNLRSPSVRALAQAVNIAVVELLDSDILNEGINESELVQLLPMVQMADFSQNDMGWQGVEPERVVYEGRSLGPVRA